MRTAARTGAAAPAARRTGRAGRRRPRRARSDRSTPTEDRRGQGGRRRAARRRSRGATPVRAPPRSVRRLRGRRGGSRARSRRSRPRPSASSRPTLRSPNDTGTPCSTSSLPSRCVAASRASTSTVVSSGRLRRMATTRGGRPAGGAVRGGARCCPRHSRSRARRRAARPPDVRSAHTTAGPRRARWVRRRPGHRACAAACRITGAAGAVIATFTTAGSGRAGRLRRAAGTCALGGGQRSGNDRDRHEAVPQHEAAHRAEHGAHRGVAAPGAQHDVPDVGRTRAAARGPGCPVRSGP